MTHDALRAKAEKLAAEKYPPVIVRGDDVFEAPRIAFTDGYVSRAAEPVTVSREQCQDLSEQLAIPRPGIEQHLRAAGLRIEGDEHGNV